jgi:D-apiose dehydrogenase
MRLGIVGLGWAARAFHAPAARRVEDVTIVGGADAAPEQRASWERETGTPTYATLAELLERERPELVVVSTPPASHAELCLQALESGAHVFCEKPFVSTVAEADAVVAAAERSDRRIAVNHEFREKPIYRALKSRIDSGRDGRLVFCQVWQLMNLAPWEEPVPWRAAMPNRTLFEGGVHLVDLICHLFGELPLAVFARRSAGVDPHREADAIHLVLLEFAAGALGQITIDRLCQSGTRYVEIRADCEHASLRASHGGRAYVQIGMKRAERPGLRIDFGRAGLAWVERGLGRKTLARNPRDDGVYGTAELLRKVVAAIEAGTEPPSSGREARDVLAVIEAAYESSATGRRIELNWSPDAAAAGVGV